MVITGTGTGGTAFLSGTGDYYFQVSWIDFGWYTDGLGTYQYLQEGPVKAQDSDQNLVDADDGWATSPMNGYPVNGLICPVSTRHQASRRMGQNLSISSVDPSKRQMVASSNPASKMLEVRSGYSGRMTPSWTTSRMHLGWILINQQPHSDIHAQHEVMIEYRRISTAQGSSGIKWFQGWTSHQVTLGG
ncbi:hypothetical protein DFH08DRAFT_810159 [Mycena albidolilacea]|uniref:Uncharacterized protein n=1 Tax=Mycena albidolilacea TaxID=1033008 RepID=A0AAD7A059_9AGAR|nr:hypothetical protein DFH08DRAFT_810159 [Mycena albidolilacea]